MAVSLLCAIPAAAAQPLTLSLERRAPGPIVFGLPLSPGQLKSTSQLVLTLNGSTLPARVDPLLYDHDKNGAPTTLRAVRVQLPERAIPAHAQLAVRFDGHAPPSTMAKVLFRDASSDSPEVVDTTHRSLVERGGRPELVESGRARRTLFRGREPNVIVTYPPGYLARTGILGRQLTAADTTAADLKGLHFFSEALPGFVASSTYEERYALEDDPDAIPDPKTSYEGWLYDRCATLLLAYVHLGDPRWLRHGFRTCTNYQSQIDLDGERGIFKGKPERDPKYSHARGLYAYYALTGDEGALAAITAIGDLWLDDKNFVQPYRQGHLRGPDKLWTERLLGTSLEGLLYAHRATGETKYLVAANELLTTAYRHITGDAAELQRINPGYHFPPQNCFIHSALQHGEGDRDQPWCSGWMVELLIDPLLRLQEQTGDRRVDEIFVRLGRFLRDVGSSYFHGDPLNDHFLQPSYCDRPDDTEDRRRLVPIYGAGLTASGERKREAQYEDTLHCADATALVAVAMRSLRRLGGWNQHPIGPFRSEGESFQQLHEELAFCAQLTFRDQTRLHRDPASFTVDQLQEGLRDPAAFIKKQLIGWPSHNVAPLRKVSWWFNSALEEFSWLRDAGVKEPELHPGRIAGRCP